ncbi:FAR-17a/AIG1-like protein [Trinorchestia longiramus]|nr:FAR-17a/AIG1-like protein [Trinorchestia longiramus]
MAILTTFHFVLAVIYGYSAYYYVFGVKPPAEIEAVRDSVYGPFKYLTYWDLLMQFVFFTLCFLSNVFTSAQGKKRKTSFENVLDFLFSSIILPTAMFVAFTFWGLYAIDRELILPKIYDSFFPVWLNHAVHTLPLVAVLVELLSVQRTFPTKKKGFLSIYIFFFIYLLWVVYIAHTTGHWVYPVLQQMSTVPRLLFFVGLGFLIGCCYVLGHYLNLSISGQGSRSEQKSSRKKK